MNDTADDYAMAEAKRLRDEIDHDHDTAESIERDRAFTQDAPLPSCAKCGHARGDHITVGCLACEDRDLCDGYEPTQGDGDAPRHSPSCGEPGCHCGDIMAALDRSPTHTAASREPVLPYRAPMSEVELQREELDNMIVWLRARGYSVEPPLPVSAAALEATRHAMAVRLSAEDAQALRRPPHNKAEFVRVCWRCDSWFWRPPGTDVHECEPCRVAGGAS